MDKLPSFYQSSRGARKLSFEGFSYCKDRIDENTGKTYWRCDDRKCRGWIITASDDRILKETQHDRHGPDVPQIAVKQSMARLRETAMLSQDGPSKIVNKELSSDFPTEFRGYFPKESSVKRTIQRQRRKVLPELPKSMEDVNISGEWQKNSRGEQWLLCDLLSDHGKDRIIVFCTDRNLQYLCYSSIWYGDGTFSVAPNFFYQLYTLHGVVMGQLLPLAYCLLTRKTKDIYQKMFLAISDNAQKRGIHVAVTSLRVDFEDACIKAFQDVFPNAAIECCFFHLSQAHWRKVADLGLRSLYLEDENFALFMRMFTSLAFVPPDRVYSVFAELCESVPDTAHAFIPYMEETYVGCYRFKSKTKPDGQLLLKRHWRDPAYPTILWNVYERTIAGEPRTNNHLEGWHRRFKSIVDKHHPNIYTFLDKLKGEQARTETVIEKLVGGEKPVEVRQKVRRTNEKIVRIVADFDSRPAMEYLRGLAYNIRY